MPQIRPAGVGPPHAVEGKSAGQRQPEAQGSGSDASAGVVLCRGEVSDQIKDDQPGRQGWLSGQGNYHLPVITNDVQAGMTGAITSASKSEVCPGRRCFHDAGEGGRALQPSQKQRVSGLEPCSETFARGSVHCHQYEGRLRGGRA